MAQIRKHRPRTSSIGDQVRASVDSGPRPIVPGEEYDPFFEEPDDTAGEAAGGFEITASAATVVSTGGWFTLDSDAMAAMLASPAATTAAWPSRAPATATGRFTPWPPMAATWCA